MKKVLSLVLALVMVLGMATVGLAADPTKIQQYDSDDVDGSNMLKVRFTTDGGANWIEHLVLEKDMEYGVSGIESAIDSDNNKFVELYPWMYDKAQGDVFAAIFVKKGSDDTVGSASDIDLSAGTSGKDGDYAWVTEQNGKKWDLGINLTGSSTFEKGGVKYVGGLAYVEFVVNDYLAGTSKKKSEDSFTVKADGKNVSSSKAKISSTLKNGEVDVEDEDDEDADLSGSEKILAPKVSISKIAIDLDNDVILNTRIFNDKKIYANVIDQVTDLSMAIMDKYGFASYYRFLSTGLTKDASTLNFDEAGTWVYAIDDSAAYDPVADTVKLVYVGRGDADLPIYEHYFFSLKELTLETEAPAEEPPVESGDENPLPPADGGPTGTVPNANFNPGTGR